MKVSCCHFCGFSEPCIEDTRALFDFFDEHGIYVSAYYRIDQAKKPIHIFLPRVSYKEDEIYTTEILGDFNSRQEAEQAAFEKSFEILEGRLKDD